MQPRRQTTKPETVPRSCRDRTEIAAGFFLLRAYCVLFATATELNDSLLTTHPSLLTTYLLMTSYALLRTPYYVRRTTSEVLLAYYSHAPTKKAFTSILATYVLRSEFILALTQQQAGCGSPMSHSCSLAHSCSLVQSSDSPMSHYQGAAILYSLVTY